MKEVGICYILFMCLFLTGFAQQKDSIDEKRVKFAIYPAIGYTPETKVNIGTIAFFVFNMTSPSQSFHRPSSVTPYLVFTTNKQALVKTDLDLFFKNGMNLNMELRLFDFPDNYYGIGNDRLPSVTEKYSDKYTEIAGNLYKPITEKLFASVVFDWQYNKIGPEAEGLLAADAPVGLNGGWVMGLGPGLRYDSRNSTLYPTKGKLASVSYTAFGKVFGSEYSYSKFLFDYRQYFDFIGPKTVVAFQVKMDMTSGRDIPFYKLSKIGGSSRLRGLEHRNLYRDRQAVYFQVEARQELFWRLGGVLFVGAGEVFDSFKDFDAGEAHLIYGLGGRFRALKDEKLNFRLDLGFTDNGQHAFYLSVREAF
ncbi:MAG: BamA/TamA family outer membrane protein [Reichenbachiella sp.]|uniref:BamA/TamA family outer membrane protein n=1 Tax=Reichenbachiella sp. TaxID=2184521 RepID=UPI003262F293